jgi:tRNA threonylcarbamoyladenosine biosynthesis protein TsaE
MFKILTKNPSQTKKIGKILAEEISKSLIKRKGALILGLVGDLGGGKTTFLQGFAKGLGIKQRITSPTFVILRRYKIPRSRTSSLRGRQNTKYKIQNFYHIDCYRILRAKELLELGLKEIISNAGNIVAIEWAEKIKKTLPKNIILVKFKFLSKSKREILLKAP